jgi:membrane protein YqaA with SNARE-associated domain
MTDAGSTMALRGWRARRIVSEQEVFVIIIDLFQRLQSASMIESVVIWLLKTLAAPAVGLTSVFIISFVSATLVPLGSEPAVFAVVKANEAMFWPAILVATVGNTLGGALDYFIGYRAKVAFAKERQTRWFAWLARYGPKTMLLSWVPGIGDPLCTMAGWLHMPFWSSVGYMMIGKFGRYVTMTALLMYVPDGVWKQIAQFVG